MARPTKPDKRDHQLNIKLTARELCWVRTRADTAGLRPGEYGRAQVLVDRPMRRRTAAAATVEPRDTLFMAQLSRLGNNLNQIARALHEQGLAAPSDLAPLLGEIRELLARRPDA